MCDGRRGKLSRETSPYPGRHGAGGSMCQARMGWAGWGIYRMVGFRFLGGGFTGRFLKITHCGFSGGDRAADSYFFHLTL